MLLCLSSPHSGEHPTHSVMLWMIDSLGTGSELVTVAYKAVFSFLGFLGGRTGFHIWHTQFRFLSSTIVFENGTKNFQVSLVVQEHSSVFLSKSVSWSTKSYQFFISVLRVGVTALSCCTFLGCSQPSLSWVFQHLGLLLLAGPNTASRGHYCCGSSSL